MSAPICSCDTYDASGVRNTCSTAGELRRVINKLRAENERLKAELAEAKKDTERYREIKDMIKQGCYQLWYFDTKYDYWFSVDFDTAMKGKQ